MSRRCHVANPSHERSRCPQHGAALVLVLWLVALLTALVGAFALSARVERLQQRVQDDAARAQEVVRAATAYTVSRLRADPLRPVWQPDGRLYRWQFDGMQADIRIHDEGGKINPNLADLALLDAFLRALDEPPESATRLAGAIIDWRDADDLSPPGGGAEAQDYAADGRPYGPRNANFETLGELQRVLGMRGDLFRRMQPMLTLYSRQARPDPRFAEAPVLTALGLDAALILDKRRQEQVQPDDLGAQTPLASGSGTYSIECRVTAPGGRVVAARTIVRNTPAPALGQAYTVLLREQGMAGQ
ncbi:type II secretion system protein GspK [Xanthomonas sp. 60]